MAAAGEEVLRCLRVLERTGDNVVGEILRGQGTFYEWSHYPEHDVFDPSTHAQYYYHAHPSDARPWREHGHFHLFLRTDGMPKGVSHPLNMDTPPPEGTDRLSHLIALSMDQNGGSIRLFTTNRWVTGETWYEADDVISMLDSFVVDIAHPNWVVNRWITAMARLFRPQIIDLVRRRDVTINNWRAEYPASDVYEDRRLDTTSSCEIDIAQQIEAISLELHATP